MNENNFNLAEVQQIKTYSTNQKHSNTIIGTMKPGESSSIIQSSMGSAKLPSSNSNPRHHPDPDDGSLNTAPMFSVDSDRVLAERDEMIKRVGVATYDSIMSLCTQGHKSCTVTMTKDGVDRNMDPSTSQNNRLDVLKKEEEIINKMFSSSLLCNDPIAVKANDIYNFQQGNQQKRRCKTPNCSTQHNNLTTEFCSNSLPLKCVISLSMYLCVVARAE